MANQTLNLFPWHVLNEHRGSKGCVLFLPGRDNIGLVMGKMYYAAGLRQPLLISITPKNLAWYPLPNGANDQQLALAGQEIARLTIDDVVQKIESKYEIPHSRIVLCGYSAGGVMAIQVASHSIEPFAGVVVHAGAILDPSNLPPCQCPKTPFLLTHCQDDAIFEWRERYVPMRKALDAQGYWVYVLERSLGGHMVCDQDVNISQLFIDACLKGSIDGRETAAAA
jgi:predicted esterase